MRTSSQLLVLLVLTVVGFCQGTISLSNLAPGLDAPIRDASGQLVPPDSEYTAEVLAGPDICCLTPSGRVPFSSPGYFGSTQDVWVVPGMEPGTHPWIVVQCRRSLGWWDPWGQPAALEIGASEVFQLDPAGPGLGETAEDAPALHGMASFQLRLAVTLSMAVEAGTVAVRWDHDPRLPLYLERATSVAGSWQVLSNAVSPYVEPAGSRSPAYFRVMALGEGLQANQAVEATQPCQEVSDDQ